MGTSKAFSLRLSFTIKTSLQLLPRKSFSTHLASQDLWLPLRDRSSNQLTLVTGRTWHSYSHRTTLNKNTVFKGPQTLPTTVHLGSAQREQAKTRISQFFSGRNLTANFPSCCLSIWLLTDLHVGAGWDPQGSFRELMGVSPGVSPQPAGSKRETRTQASPWKEFFHPSGTPIAIATT